MTGTRIDVAEGDFTVEAEVDRVFRTLKSWLIECKLRPGEVLSEVRLAELCRTSRTPVREALNRIAQDKWIVRIPRKGYLVTPVSVRDIVETYEHRKALECYAAEKAALTATDEEIARLEQIIRIENGPPDDPSGWFVANEKFHLGLAELTGNHRIIDRVRLVLEFVRRMDTLAAQKEFRWVPHGEIVRTIRARQPGDARDKMGEHVDQSRDRMLMLFSR